MPDFEAFKREQVAHLARLAREPGWKPYVKRECEEMARNFPHQFADMTELVRKELEKEQTQ